MVRMKKSEKSKKAKKETEKDKKKDLENEERDEGVSLDDAFSDSDDVEYGESKPRREKKKSKEKEDKLNDEEMEEELEEVEEEVGEIEKEINGSKDDRSTNIILKASKPVKNIKKGDKIKVDGTILEVDQHYVLIDHKTTKEMAIECFDPKTNKEYQIRYFDDQVEGTIEFYELQEIMYLKKQVHKIEW